LVPAVKAVLAVVLAAGLLAAAPPGAAAPAAAPVTWEQLDTPGYAEYLARLRAAGAPEDKVRLIVEADAEEWLQRRRSRAAVEMDIEWWRTQADQFPYEAFQNRFAELREQRRELLRRHLGEGYREPAEPEDARMIAVLTGPVLGALPPDKFKAVLEVCGRSAGRSQDYLALRLDGQAMMNQSDLARHRDQTRVELARLLTPAELEEFLLRNSQNASRLRMEFAGLSLAPDEFRRVFRAVDALDHQMQLEYGAVDSLSARQREEFEQRRAEAIKKSLAGERYRQYLASRYPLYRTAQLAVKKAGLPDDLALAVFEVMQANENRRRRVQADTLLSAAEKTGALKSLEEEKQAALRRALGDDTYRVFSEAQAN
jgi:hypothetical protein